MSFQLKRQEAQSVSIYFWSSVDIIFRLCDAYSDDRKKLTIQALQQVIKTQAPTARYISQAFTQSVLAGAVGPEMFEEILDIRRYVTNNTTDLAKAVVAQIKENDIMTKKFSFVSSAEKKKQTKEQVSAVVKAAVPLGLPPELIKRLNPELTDIKVYRSTTYKGVKHLPGQRVLIEPHIQELVNSIKQKDLLDTQFVLLNEHGEAVDGQHKLAGAEKTGKPFYFIVKPGLGLDDVLLLNNTSKKWTMESYLDSYIQLHKYDIKENKIDPEKSSFAPYLKLREFMNKHNLWVNLALPLLCGEGKLIRDNFKKGILKVTNWSSAEKVLELSVFLSAQYHVPSNITKSVYFLRSLMRMVKHPEFSESIFRQKIDFQSTKLVRCPDTSSYTKLLEEIYNTKNRTPIFLSD